MLTHIVPAATLVSAKIEDTFYSIGFKLPEKEPITFTDFVKEYRKQYASEWFVNPWSTMNKLLNSQTIKSMSDVYDYTFANPKTRTAKILRRMIADQSLLSNDAVIFDAHAPGKPLISNH